MKHLIRNEIKTPDGTILTSRHRHDFVSYRDAITQELYFVDGGHEYIRGSVNKVKAEYLYVYSDGLHEIIREAFEWGSYGKNGDEKLHYIVLKNMAEEHIRAILKTQRLEAHIKKIFEDELKWREEND